VAEVKEQKNKNKIDTHSFILMNVLSDMLGCVCVCVCVCVPCEN
jgi:hypothetical protein